VREAHGHAEEARVIPVSRLDGSAFFLNSDLIETIEATPDTVVTLTSQKKLIVRESPQDLIEALVAFRRRVFAIGPQLVERQPSR
jgi:flagellar protein FlbD